MELTKKINDYEYNLQSERRNNIQLNKEVDKISKEMDQLIKKIDINVSSNRYASKYEFLINILPAVSNKYIKLRQQKNYM